MAWIAPFFLLVFVTAEINYSDGFQLTDDGPVVQTQYGPVKGMYVEEGFIFFGLPFAAPPTGDLRWKPPQPFNTSWAPATYDASTPRPGCIQGGCKPSDSDPRYECPRGRKMSEDCLYLNIFAPRNALNTTAKLPVMFWIHGGSFISGSGTSEVYDCRFLANKTDTIVVSTNYRLGALGFLVTGEGEDAATGNYGLLDQIESLTWVKENIEKFGGDKDQVTIFGESAGADSVAFHLTTKRSSDLFQRAIMMSVPFGVPFKGHGDAVRFGNHFSKLLNCGQGDMTCLRSANANDVLQAQKKAKSYIVNPFDIPEMFMPWAPIVDGDIVPEQVVDSFADGHAQKKPFIVGTTSEEAVVMIYDVFTKPMSKSLYYEAALGLWHGKAPSVIKEYPAASSGDARANMSVYETDFLFACPSRKAIRGAIAEGNSEVWLYVFDHVWSFKGLWKGMESCDGHVCHGEDIPFTFQTSQLIGLNMTADEQIMADTMAYHYGNFAHTGDPNKPSRHVNTASTIGDDMNWPKYNKEGGFTNLKFSTPKNELVQKYRGEKCDFWDELNVYP